MISTPRASSTSADPVREDADAATVLADRHSSSGNDECGDRRNIDGPGPVAASPAGVREPLGELVGKRDGLGNLEHGLQHAGQFFGGLPLAAQAENKSRYLRSRRRPVQDLAHRHGCLGRCQVLASAQAAEHAGPPADIDQ